MKHTDFTYLKKGDLVTRMLAGVCAVETEVTLVDDDFVYTSPPGANWPIEQGWKFRRSNGAEVDEELGFDGITLTGSYLVHEEQKEHNERQ